MQEDAVAMLVRGVIKVMGYLGMMGADVLADTLAKSQIPSSKSLPAVLRTAMQAGQANSKAVKSKENPHLNPLPKGEAGIKLRVLTRFEWLYTKHAGMWYPDVTAGDEVKDGQKIGGVEDLFGDTLEEIISPVSGIVLFLTINPSVIENGLLMGIGCG